jgi:hypothetical protein
VRDDRQRGGKDDEVRIPCVQETFVHACLAVARSRPVPLHFDYCSEWGVAVRECSLNKQVGSPMTTRNRSAASRWRKCDLDGHLSRHNARGEQGHQLEAKRV